MGELFFFFMSWKNLKYFFLFDPIGMTQQMVYNKEKEQFSENKLFGIYSSKHIVFITVFSVVSSIKRLVPIFS